MARKKKKEEGGGGGGGHETAGGMRWLLTYADCITLLLGVFIILASVITKPPEEQKKLAEAFERYFKIFPSGSNTPITGGKGLLPQKTPETSIKARFRSELKTELESEKVKTIETSDEKELIVRFKDTVFFPLGSAEILPSARPLLDKIAQLIESIPHRVRVEGHTCSLPLHSSKYESNWELSTARASAVVRYFIEHARQNKIFKDEKDFRKFCRRLEAAGFADTRLIDSKNPTSPVNRRIDICIYKTSEKEVVSLFP